MTHVFAALQFAAAQARLDVLFVVETQLASCDLANHMGDTYGFRWLGVNGPPAKNSAYTQLPSGGVG